MRILGDGILKAIKTTADNGWDYVIATNQGPGESDKLHLKPVVFLIQEGEKSPDEFEAISEAIEQADIKTTVKPGKTPSQRLRSTLYVLWEQKGLGEFNDYYNTKIEEIINHFKSKLE